ncbi:MAG: hypothetical protein QW393_03410 [Candidatus Micrarchaeaceae archaeon]
MNDAEEVKKEIERLHIGDEESYKILLEKGIMWYAETQSRHWRDKFAAYQHRVLIRKLGWLIPKTAKKSNDLNFMADDYKIYAALTDKGGVELTIRFTMKGKEKGTIWIPDFPWSYGD